MLTYEQLREESKKLEEYLKQEKYKKDKNAAAEEAIKNNNITITDVKHMTTEQINANWETIKKIKS